LADIKYVPILDGVISSEQYFLELISTYKREENWWGKNENGDHSFDHRDILLDDPYWGDFYEEVQEKPEQLNFE